MRNEGVTPSTCAPWACYICPMRYMHLSYTHAYIYVYIHMLTVHFTECTWPPVQHPVDSTGYSTLAHLVMCMKTAWMDIAISHLQCNFIKVSVNYHEMPGGSCLVRRSRGFEGPWGRAPCCACAQWTGTPLSVCPWTLHELWRIGQVPDKPTGTSTNSGLRDAKFEAFKIEPCAFLCTPIYTS